MVGHKRFFFRIFEMMPGFLLWLTFLLGILLSFVRQLWVIYFIIVFDLYWLFRVLYFIVILIFAWRKYKKSLTIDWSAKLQEKKDWQDIVHLIFLPMSKEGGDIVDASLKALSKTRYP